jgi:hypothetical protein
MAETIKDQLLRKGLVAKEDTVEAKRAAARAAEPVDTEKEFPPPFEAPARGVIVASTPRPPAAARTCAECGSVLPPSQRGESCAECQAQGA